MAAAAAPCRFAQVAARRVRIVAAGAAARRPNLRMIRMHGSVAIGAGLLRASANIVRRVAVRALVVSRHAGRRQDHHFRVARTAWLRRFLLELVGPMTTDTFAVSARKERARRHDWTLAGVAALARPESL